MIWIDTNSGTWGYYRTPDTSPIVVLDETILDSESPDEESIIAFLDNATDSEIIEIGKRFGKTIN